jgi:chromosome segregation ATPase
VSIHLQPEVESTRTLPSADPRYIFDALLSTSEPCFLEAAASIRATVARHAAHQATVDSVLRNVDSKRQQEQDLNQRIQDTIDEIQENGSDLEIMRRHLEKAQALDRELKVLPPDSFAHHCQEHE